MLDISFLKEKKEKFEISYRVGDLNWANPMELLLSYSKKIHPCFNLKGIIDESIKSMLRVY